MRALKIDVGRQEVTEVAINPSSFNREAKELLGCTGLDGFRLPNRHYCYVDDEGFFGLKTGYFLWNNEKPIAGSGLIVGPPDRDGYDTAATFSLAEVREWVQFYRPDEVSIDTQPKGPNDLTPPTIIHLGKQGFFLAPVQY